MITLAQAMTANEFWHASEKNADGTPQRWRRNGKTQTWKKWPGLFRIPVKHGMKHHGYIQNFTDEHDGKPMSPKGNHIQFANHNQLCVPELWEAEHVLFEGVTT